MGKGNFSPFCTESRPPTYSSISNNSITDVGVRLNGKKIFFSPQLVALPLLRHTVPAIFTKWEGDIQAVASC